MLETDVVTVRPDLPVRSLMGVLEESQITGAPVVDDNRLAGLVTTMGIVAAVAEAAGE